MGDHCMVISGEWKFSPDGKWDFVIDKQRMSRVVSFQDGMSIGDLRKNVLQEFFADGGSAMNVELSYWPPNTTELATGITTPPVMVTNGPSISYFCKHFSVKNELNLFDTFAKRVNSAPPIEISGALDGYTTPKPPIKRPRFRDDITGEGMFGLGIDNAGDYGSSVASRKPPLDIDDDILLRHMETVENAINSGTHTAEDLYDLNTTSEKSVKDIMDELRSEANRRGYTSEDLNTDDEDTGQETWDDFDVRPLGIDEEFWEPHVDDVYGGSDTADFMCSTDEDPNQDGPRVYRSSTNDAFDHTVIQGGDGGVWKTEGRGVAATSPASSGLGQAGVQSDNPYTYGQHSMDSNQNRGQPQQHTAGASYGRRAADADTPSRRPTNTSNNGNDPQPTAWTDDNGQTKNTSYCPRSLGSIDDEEFDIPPLFDDTLYESTDIHNLDIDKMGGDVAVGKVYSSKKDCQVALAIHAIKNMFNFRQSTTKHNYFVVICTDERCDWRVLAVQVKYCGYYGIKKANLEHTCCIETRSMFKKRASSRVIAAVFKAKYGDPVKGPWAADLQQLVLEELRVAASYMKCYMAPEKAITYVRGTDDDSYIGLPEYLYILKLANPGTVADLETEKDDEGVDRFLYLFLSFGASIKGFRRLRHVIVLDGTHLTGKFMGTLLTASGQDANFQVFPLAFAMVDSENNESWMWFLQKLDRILADSTYLTIISDRHPSIKVPITMIYPKANHAACIVHLARNVTSRYKSKGLAKMVVKAAFAFRVGAFRKIYADITKASPECARYLHKIGIAHWARAHFPGERYNLMTSNAAEQLNKALRGGRNSPIMELLKFIQDMMTRSFGAFWSIWDVRSMEDLAHGRSSTGYAKEEGGSHLEDQLDHLLDQPVEFLNSTGQASTRSS
ncbi:unnamed protein product [Microthlaspi erraticum]|uniref:MULE transposase domain-containing protein n=1 Tax=Microthlaspi erraticum TaxID=1685480 RepID=A0A6D2HK64_9BRAS|nr:unnamed protein product [Microthlaspi erraticum]